MSTIHIPARPPGYLERQGYVKSLWEVRFYRNDVYRTYAPDDEAYNLPALKENLESDKYSVATIDRVTVELTRTDELVAFLRGLADPKRLQIKVFTYHVFHKGQKQLVWFGQLENLPEGVDAYPWDKLKLTFISPPGAWEEGDGVKDPETKGPYRNKHVTDVLLPEFLEKARWQGKWGTGDWKLEEPKVVGENYFWSGVEVPKKRLVDSNREYDDTYLVKSICWDSKRKRLYMGVSPHPNEQYRDPWLVSYEPATRKWRKVTKFFYDGTQVPENMEWEVLHVEYDAQEDKVRFVCQTTGQDLMKTYAHIKCYGAIDVASPPWPYVLQDSNLFTLHNKGFTILSKYLEFLNELSTSEDVKIYAKASAQCIGWGTPRGEKEHGVLKPAGEIKLRLCRDVKKGSFELPVEKPQNEKYYPSEDSYVEIHDAVNKHGQSLGLIRDVNEEDDCFVITVEIETYYDFPRGTVFAGSVVYMYKPGYHPFSNVFVAKPQNVNVGYMYPEKPSRAEPTTIYVEARKKQHGREQFFYPREIGKVDEEGEYCIDRVGYTSFISFREMDILKAKSGEDRRYHSGPVTAFTVTFEGYNPTFLLADGFLVANDPQPRGLWGPSGQPGPCKLLRYGEPCKVVGEKEIETYGDIFLFKDDSEIYVAWNDHGQDRESGEYYAKCKIAKWVKGNEFEKWHLDRWPENWKTRPECYLTSFARCRDIFYGGRQYYEPNWVHTNIRIFWASPPADDDQPADFDGGLAAVAFVVGDQTELIQVGDLIRIGGYMAPSDKVYYVSEAYAELRQPHFSEENKWHFAKNWRDITETWGSDDFLGKVTVLVLLSINPFEPGINAYTMQVYKELLGDFGRYISVKKGRDERHQIWAHEGSWVAKYTAKPTAPEPREGKEVEHEAKPWKGEGHTVEYDGDYVRMPRVKLKEKNVVGGSIAVTLKDSQRALELSDLTDFEPATCYQYFPFPRDTTCYAHRKQGDDYAGCYLYFNPDLEGEEIDVVYRYYAVDAALTCPVIFDGKLYFNESGDRHRFLKVYRSGGETKVENTYSPRVGDRELTCVAAGDDRVFAISAPSNLLVQFAKEWSGYVHEVDGKGKKIWNVVADLARAGDQYCFDRLGTLYVVNRDTPTEAGTFPHILKITRKDLPPYEKVVFSYANGKVELGAGKPELALSCNCVYDKAHAEILCRKAYQFYTVKRREYSVECAGILEQIGLCEEKKFEYLGKPASGIVVGRQFSPKGTTTFTVVEKPAPREGEGAGDGYRQEG